MKICYKKQRKFQQHSSLDSVKIAKEETRHPFITFESYNPPFYGNIFYLAVGLRSKDFSHERYISLQLSSVFLPALRL